MAQAPAAAADFIPALMLYAVAFLAALAVDSIPVFAPPAWMILVFLIVKYQLNPWGVLTAGVFGSVLGRYLLSLYIPKVSRKILSARENENVAYVGKKIGKHLGSSFVFVLIYSVTPLSTTALFTAAGIARINPAYILPPFCIGKFISDAVMVFTGKYETRALVGLLHGEVSFKTGMAASLGFLLIALVLFIDWPQLLIHKKLRFHFKIWK
jgi:membrane protein YqaA with SNARE-associated domain